VKWNSNKFKNMEEKKVSTYGQAGDTYKAMLLQAHPQSPLYRLASYEICKCVLKQEELHEYKKLDEKYCSSYKVAAYSGPTSLIGLVIASFTDNIYSAIIAVLAGAVYLVAINKQCRAEKQIKLIEDLARVKFDKEWSGTTALDKLGV
jgi:hypothetical protein